MRRWWVVWWGAHAGALGLFVVGMVSEGVEARVDEPPVAQGGVARVDEPPVARGGVARVDKPPVVRGGVARVVEPPVARGVGLWWCVAPKRWGWTCVLDMLVVVRARAGARCLWRCRAGWTARWLRRCWCVRGTR